MRTILIIDDSASTLFYLSMLLKRLEYKVETARSAEEALMKMESKIPSVILTEAVLPVVNGVALLKRIKEDDRYKGIPVIILTSESDSSVKEACSALGCAGYLQKPVEPDFLYRTVQAVSETLPRANIRLKTSIRVMVGDGSAMGGAERMESAIALSEGGMYVKTGYPQPKKAITPVRIFLPDGVVVTAKAEVLYNCTIPAGPYAEPGMGMRFSDISDGDRSQIRRFIKDTLTADLQQ